MRKEPIIEKIPTPSNIQCKEFAKELIPKYIHVPNDFREQSPIYWKDGNIEQIKEFGLGFGLECFRQGSEKRENINYLYYEPGKSLSFSARYCPDNLSYSKQITDKTGVIVGYNQFSIRPIIKKYDPFKINTSLMNTSLIDYIVRIEWSGFGEEAFFNAYQRNTITFKVEHMKSLLSGYETACEIATKNESGYFECNLKQSSGRGEFKVTASPSGDEIYEIVEPNIISCDWVTNQNQPH